LRYADIFSKFRQKVVLEDLKHDFRELRLSFFVVCSGEWQHGMTTLE